MAHLTGTIRLTVESAKNLTDKDKFGKQDPYVVIKYGNEQPMRTKTITDGGTDCKWDDGNVFTFKVDKSNEITVIAKDDDRMGRDDEIGKAIVSLTNARAKMNDKQEVVLTDKKGKPQGYVTLSFKFTPDTPTQGATYFAASAMPPNMVLPGVLRVKVHSGKDLTDMDIIGKQDPYCILKCGDQEFRTRVHDDGGRNPKWEEEFEFQIMEEDTFRLECYDEDLTGSDLIGIATVSLVNARTRGSEKKMAALLDDNGKNHGYISLSLTFTAAR